MPGLCGLLNHSLDRSLRPLPLLALSCPLALFFILFLPHCKLEKPVQGLGFYHAQNRSHYKPGEAAVRPARRDWTLVLDAWLRYHFVLFGYDMRLRGRDRCSRAPRRTLPFHDLEPEVDDRLFGAPAFDRLDDHHGSVSAHFVTIGAHAGEGRDRRRHELEVVETNNGHLLGNRDLPSPAFEQYTESEVVIGAEHRVGVRRLGEKVGQQRTAERN